MPIDGRPWLAKRSIGDGEKVNEQDFAYAGLLDRWEGQGKVIESCTIIVTDANEAVREIHERMPVILEPTDYGHWLDPSVNDVSLLKPLLRPWRSDNLTIRRVSKRINSARNDAPSLINDVRYDCTSPTYP